MPPAAPQPSVLLLERVEIEPTVTVDGASNRTDAGPWPVVASPSEVASITSFRAPGLALLAAVSVLEGYRWFGVIDNRGSRPFAAAFAVVALVGSLALTRAVPGLARNTVQRLLIVVAAVVAMATAAVLWNHWGWTSDANGVADLTLASLALVAFVSGERVRRRSNVAP